MRTIAAALSISREKRSPESVEFRVQPRRSKQNRVFWLMANYR